ncbi:DNA ligase (NAD+) [Lacrimispora sphenoides]|uniref:NAD-dependent DNA ligase LigA n=1 Tax=Lacrimispora sphenoides TaxID=29370 RepID=UPI0008CFED7A|nr:NAD-dependent DNA ligase LigA [Lacrimispora sphenoides]SEU09822.1 DNA ligase (NAD+) [Lacrimispora sphenoides]
MTDIERIKELTNLLNHHRNQYYNKNNSEISDQEYDKLFDELKEKEDKTGFCLANSPTQSVGYLVQSKLQKSIHEYPMLSLDKTKSPDELLKFIGKRDAVLMLKLDGLTVCLTYDNGVLLKAESRGDGAVGEDITENAKTFCNIPLTIPYKNKLVVFGEAIIDYNTFYKINSELPDEKNYKNPRNLCSGTVRQLDSKICADRKVKFIAWRLVEGSDENNFFTRLNKLDEYGFDVVPWRLIGEDILNQLQNMRVTAESYDYPIDGCVVSFTDISYMESLGATSHHLRGQLAFKYAEDQESTILREIEWSMGKTGNLTPVAIFDPVELAGTTVSRASLHNISIMKDLDIKVGANVTVVKKNEIIPQIIECDADVAEFEIPDTCPICGGKTAIVKVNDTEVLTCTDADCKGKLLGRLTHYSSKNALNIDGLSEATLEKFMELGWLNQLSDIYTLDSHKEKMVKLDGFGKKSAEKLLAAIEKSKNTTLERYLYGLSIALIGKTASKTISKQFNGDYSKFIEALEDGFDFTQLNDFGATMNSSIYAWYEKYSDSEDAYIPTLLDFEKPKAVIVADNNKDLSGMVFVITGNLTHYSNRNELVEEIERLGGKVSGSVSVKTTYLINNSLESNSGKNKKAKELGVSIITEEQFISMIK